MNERIDNWASELLEALSQIVPDVKDDGILGRLILEKALETYNFVIDIN